jgi:phospholipid/cholesterol/gamma-HCH transport system substrate-binding protein
VTGLAAGGWYLRSSARYVTYRIEAHDPVSGPIVDSPVELHGVEIGNVARIELTDSRTGGIWLHIAKDAPISRAMVATITAAVRRPRGLGAKPVLKVGPLLVRLTGSVGR